MVFLKKVIAHSVENIGTESGIDLGKFGKPASDDAVQMTAAALEKNGFDAIVVETAQEALDALKKLIPHGAEVMNGSSTTLGEIGFLDYFKDGTHGWKNAHAEILAETDGARQGDLRRKATAAEYFISSAQAITQNGEIVGCDASGSRVGAWLFAAKHLVIVAGTNKVVPDIMSAMVRIAEHAYRLENVRAQKVYGSGSNVAKVAVLNSDYPGRTTVILVKEALGY